MVIRKIRNCTCGNKGIEKNFGKIGLFICTNPKCINYSVFAKEQMEKMKNFIKEAKLQKLIKK